MPHPDVLEIIASNPLFKYSSYQIEIFFLNIWLAKSFFPKWWFIEPQQSTPFETTTSMLCRFNNLIVASLIWGEITFCTHPVSKATLATGFFLLTDGYTSILGSVFFGNFPGISLIISLIRFGNKKMNGFINWVKMAINLKLVDLDNILDNISLVNLSLKGLVYVFSMWLLPWSIRCI